MTNENKLIDWREELYQAFHNMPSGVDKRTEKFHEIAKMIDSVFHSHTKEVVEKWVSENEYCSRCCSPKKFCPDFGKYPSAIDTKDLLAFLASLEDNKK